MTSTIFDNFVSETILGSDSLHQEIEYTVDLIYLPNDKFVISGHDSLYSRVASILNYTIKAGTIISPTPPSLCNSYIHDGNLITINKRCSSELYNTIATHDDIVQYLNS